MYLFTDYLILYRAGMHNGNILQEVSSSFITAKIGTFFSYLMFPFQCIFYVLLLFAWPLYWTVLCLWSLCSWVALWILGRIHPSIFCKSSLHLLVLYSVYPSLLYHHWDYWFIQLFHSCEICSWSTTCFSNDGLIAEDPVCFYWFTRILLSTVGVLLNYQMS